MTKRCITLTAAAAVVLASASPVAAQGIRSPYEFVEARHSIHAYATYMFTDRGVIGIGPAAAPAVGAGYGFRISGPFNIDTRVAFMQTHRTVYITEPADTAALREDPMAGLVELGAADLSLLLFDASLRFDITGPRTWYRLQPYALIGTGAVFRVAEDRSIEEEVPEQMDVLVRFQNGFTGHIGGGVEWHATDRFTIRFDARDVLWRLHVPSGFITGGRVIDDRQWVQTGHLSVGAAIRF